MNMKTAPSPENIADDVCTCLHGLPLLRYPYYYYNSGARPRPGIYFKMPQGNVVLIALAEPAPMFGFLGLPYGEVILPLLRPSWCEVRVDEHWIDVAMRAYQSSAGTPFIAHLPRPTGLSQNDRGALCTVTP